MNKWLVALLIVALLTITSLGTYYYFFLRQNQTSSSLLQQVAPKLTVPARGSTLSGWRKQVASECKEVEAVDLSYLSKLADAIGGVTFDQKDKAFYTNDATQQIVFQRISRTSMTPAATDVTCSMLWVGYGSGAGTVAYENTLGQIKTIHVEDYSPPPAPTPTPTY